MTDMSDKKDVVPIEDQKSEVERIIVEHSPYWAKNKSLGEAEYGSRMRRLKAVLETLNWIERNRAKLKAIK